MTTIRIFPASSLELKPDGDPKRMRLSTHRDSQNKPSMTEGQADFAAGNVLSMEAFRKQVVRYEAQSHRFDRQ